MATRLFDRLGRAVGRHRIFRLLSVYPPYLGAGIHVTFISEDLRTIEVELRLTRLNRNYVGTHFGGSLYAMCDPFFMLILLENLGREFIVWDKAASIRFLRPGRGTVTARFQVSAERIDEIRHAATEQGKVEPEFEVEVKDAHGEVVARVHKTLYVRRKDAKVSAPP